MKNGKRILSVTVRRMIDESPDTSWLGKYSNRPETEYAIDRAHAENCASSEANHFQAVETLERIISHLNNERMTCDCVTRSWYGAEHDSACPLYQWNEVEESIDALVSLQDEAMECDCSGGDMGRRELRYFNGPVENYKGESPEDIRKYVRQDYARAEALNRGDWSYIGLKAEAIVETGSHITQRISSGGLWGVESDSDASYFAEIQRDELAGLKAELIALGFSRRSISTAFKNVVEKGD